MAEGISGIAEEISMSSKLINDTGISEEVFEQHRDTIEALITEANEKAGFKPKDDKYRNLNELSSYLEFLEFQLRAAIEEEDDERVSGYVCVLVALGMKVKKEENNV